MIEMNQDNIQQLRDKVADIKYDTQQVLDRIDSMDAAYQEQTGREQTLERDLSVKTSQAEAWRKEYEKAKKEAEFYTQKYSELAQGMVVPTMPVIPKDVAIAIFREGVQHGVEAACTELEGQSIEVSENEYYGHFEVSFNKEIDLDDELDLDWMRGKCGDFSEERVIDALGTLCADKEFECRIHGIDDQQTKDND